MPLYEYSCGACETRFEVLQTMGASADGVTCTACGETRVQRELSTFATASPNGGSWAADCAGEAAELGGCGAGACGAPRCAN